MSNTINDSETIIKAIANEYRRNIIRIIFDNAMSYTEIAHLLGFDLKKESGKFNFHLKELVEADLVVNRNESYQLTEKGREVYYLLIDIERDHQVDPHGMITGLIRLKGHREFFFFLASLVLVGSLQSVLFGTVALFALGQYLPLQLLGGVLVGGGLVALMISGKYYINTVNELLGERSTLSKLVSSFFLLNVQWYFIRVRYRMHYLAATFSLLFGWVMTMLGAMLHLAQLGGIENPGPVVFVLEAIGFVTLVIGVILLRILYSKATINSQHSNIKD